MTSYQTLIIFEDGTKKEDGHSSLENALNEISNTDDDTSKIIIHVSLWAVT